MQPFPEPLEQTATEPTGCETGRAPQALPLGRESSSTQHEPQPGIRTASHLSLPALRQGWNRPESQKKATWMSLSKRWIWMLRFFWPLWSPALHRVGFWHPVCSKPPLKGRTCACQRMGCTLCLLMHPTSATRHGGAGACPAPVCLSSLLTWGLQRASPQPWQAQQSRQHTWKPGIPHDSLQPRLLNIDHSKFNIPLSL